MSIDFPPAVDGTTYTYNQITYTFVKDGANVGYWTITTPGTVGVASTAEIDAGTDPVKYLTPLQLDTATEWAKLKGVEVGATADQTAAQINNVVYPVGSIYQAVVSTDPSILLGVGVWEKLAKGRTLVGDGNGSGLTNRVAGTELGWQDAVIPYHRHGVSHNHNGFWTLFGGSHNHTIPNQLYATSPNDESVKDDGADDGKMVGSQVTGSSTHQHYIDIPNHAGNTDYTGSGLTDRNMQPALVVYIWKRIS